MLQFLVGLAVNSAFAQEEWKFQKEDEGIKVYTRYVDGSDVKAFKAETVLKGELSSFVAVLKDVDSFYELFSTNHYAELIEESDTFMLHYSQTHAPWPVKDRDGVYESRFSQHYGTKAVTVDIRSVDGIRPENDDFVRINSAKGSWLLMPVDNNAVEVTYTMQADPGGSLPGWVVNLFLVDSPIKDLKKLQERLKLDKYANRKFDFLMDY